MITRYQTHTKARILQRWVRRRWALACANRRDPFTLEPLCRRRRLYLHRSAATGVLTGFDADALRTYAASHYHDSPLRNPITCEPLPPLGGEPAARPTAGCDALCSCLEQRLASVVQQLLQGDPAVEPKIAALWCSLRHAARPPPAAYLAEVADHLQRRLRHACAEPAQRLRLMLPPAAAAGRSPPA